MKILLINLPRYKNSSVTREGRCELILNYRVDTPATLLIIASQLREINQAIRFIDANGLNINYKKISYILEVKNFDCVIFTFNSQIIDYELEICDIIKKNNPSCKLIGYSWYARTYVKEILNEYKNLDILIYEDPFSVVTRLIKTLQENNDLNNVDGIAFRDSKNQIIITSKLKSLEKFEDIPIPAYDLLKNLNPYYIYTPFIRPYALIYAGKGCPFKCKYCNVANTRYSGRSAKSIIEELKILKRYHKVKYVWFYDEIFTLNRRRTLELCENLIKEKLKIKWFCDSRVDIIDLNLLQIMKKAGCIGIAFGVESGSQDILNSMNKGITVTQAKNALKWARKAHIPIQLNIILGYLNENEKTIEETRNFIRSTNPEFLQITKMNFFENTEFSEIALKRKWISKETNWKLNLTKQKMKVLNYKPFELNLFKESKILKKLLYSNPIWWFISLKTLIYNHYLLFPIIGTLFRRFSNKNIV